MSVDFTKVDAALFAIEGFISRLLTHADNLDHADYYLSMTRSLRGSIARDRFDNAVSLPEPTEEMEKRLLRVSSVITPQAKPRAKDKGQMSSKQRQAISKKMKKYWVKRRKAERKH